MESLKNKRRSGFKIMLNLIGLVKPLFHVMIVAILFGVIGFLCAIFLSIFAGIGLVKIFSIEQNSLIFSNYSIKGVLTIMVIIAVLRGVFHYIEQYCNHFIAFKLLAIIRHKVFHSLRKLAPAKLEVKDRGNLISIITTDIELLEVFYAHTISPIIIAFITCLIMFLFIARYSIISAIFALVAYITIGVIIPLINGKKGKDYGMKFRDDFGEMNSFVLESLRGLDEIIQYDGGKDRKNLLVDKSEELSNKQSVLSNNESRQRAITSSFILIFSFGMLFLTIYLNNLNLISKEGAIISTISMMGSFGPVVALSALSNSLNQTLASGERVLSILEEQPIVEEVKENNLSNMEFNGFSVNNIDFSYFDNETILKDFSLEIPKNKIMGIHGKSGSGKSTLLKLLMRFWDVDNGEIKISNENIKNIPTNTLRDIESYITQETHLFQGSIYDNILIGNLNATKEEVIEATKKASIYDFIMSLPNGFDTQVGELGSTLSGGEKQRISIARAFLHKAPVILLDEPTSNLDALNEGIILKSLKESSEGNTIILVSHRKSTMNIVDDFITVENGRIS